MADVNKSGITPHLPIMDHVGVYGRSLRTRKSSQAGGGDVPNRPATGHTLRCLGTTKEPETGVPSSEVGDKAVTPGSCDPQDTPRGLESKAKRDE